MAAGAGGSRPRPGPFSNASHQQLIMAGKSSYHHGSLSLAAGNEVVR